MTAEEDFHCIVTHPDSNFDYTRENKDDDNFVVTLKKDDVPLVVLLGWSGALDKHLQVYSKIYEEKGFITMRYLCPVMYTMWYHKKMLPCAKKLVEILNKPDLQKRDIIFHTFSNGGSFSYEYLAKALQDDSTATHQIKGIIFDSAPSKLTFPRVYRAINSMKRDSNTLWTKAESFFIVSVHFSKKLINRIYGKLINKHIYEWDPIDNLKNDISRCPQHLIYSKADLMVYYKEVEYFMKYRQSLGVDVTSKVYEDTPHVRHYPFNKLSYKRSIFQFLSKCLRR